MAPIWLSWLTSSPAAHLLTRQGEVSTTSPTSVAAYVAAQWRNPSDTLSVLLLVGPEVIKNAIAQLAGRTITPVAFSFGWVAYGVAALVSSFGDGRLMPDSESTLLVIEPNTCHIRQTKNWILGRLWRDVNDRLDHKVKDEGPHETQRDCGTNKQKRPPANPVEKDRLRDPGHKTLFEALRVSVFELEDNVSPQRQGVPLLDWVWYMGVFVIAVQLIIAAIPWIIDGQWDIFLVTAAGNLFAMIGGSLPQWRREKWACPKEGSQTIAITEGNGSRSVIVILGKPSVGLDLEILAQGTRTAPASLLTRLVNALLAILWILLLITVAAIRQNSWCKVYSHTPCAESLSVPKVVIAFIVTDTLYGIADLLGTGLLGSIQNFVAASISRSPAALGLYIKKKETFSDQSVSEVLKRVERRYPLLGTALLDVFFPGSMRVNKEDVGEIAFWRAAIDLRYKENKHGIRLDRLPSDEVPEAKRDGA